MESPKLVEHYEKIFENQRDDFRNSTLRELVVSLLDAKKPASGRRVLDIGCGTGHFTLMLLKKGCEVTAVDAVTDMVDFCRRVCAGSGYSPRIEQVTVEETGKRFPRGSFDHILMIDVLEHVEDDRAALRDLHGLLAPGGSLILVVPAYSGLYGKRDADMGHYRRYDKRELLRKVEAAGFAVEKKRYWNFLCLPPFFFFEKMLGRKPAEGMRYGKKKGFRKLVGESLRWWFSAVENNIDFKAGLSLVLVCRKRETKQHE